MLELKCEKEYFTESKNYFNALKIYNYEQSNMKLTTYYTEDDLMKIKMRYYDFVHDTTSFTIKRIWNNTIDSFTGDYF